MLFEKEAQDIDFIVNATMLREAFFGSSVSAELKYLSRKGRKSEFAKTAIKELYASLISLIQNISP